MLSPGSLKLYWLKIWTLLCALVVAGMAVHRADNASFTHDESYSYLYYPRLSVAELLSHTEPFTNNHLLNSLGMKVSEELFGTSSFILRIPNLIALVIFLIYGILFLRGLDPLVCALGIPLLFGNTYVMEFFTLARGYGLSFGFMMMAVFHLYKAITTQRTTHLVVFHMASILASLANFTLMGTHVAGIITYYMGSLLSRPVNTALWTSLVKGTIVHAVAVLTAWSVLSGPIENVLQENKLDFGGKSSFYQSTMLTWAKSMAPGHPGEGVVVAMLQAVLVSITLLSVGMLVWHSTGRGKASPAHLVKLLVVTCMLVLTCIGAEMQHFLFGFDRLVDRFALFLVPLVVLQFILLAQAAVGPIARPLAMSVLMVGAVHTSFTFLRDFGPYRSIEWQYDVNTKDAILAVLHDLDEHPLGHTPATVSGNWLLDPAWNYYRTIWKREDLAPWHRSNGLVDTDIRLVLSNDPLSSHKTYRQVAHFPASGCTVLRKIVPSIEEAVSVSGPAE